MRPPCRAGRDVPHADLVAVVDGRQRGPGHQEHERRRHLVGGARAGTSRVKSWLAVGSDDVAAAGGDGVGRRPPLGQERRDGAAARGVEVARPGDLAPGGVVRADAVVPQRRGAPGRGTAGRSRRGSPPARPRSGRPTRRAGPRRGTPCRSRRACRAQSRPVSTWPGSSLTSDAAMSTRKPPIPTVEPVRHDVAQRLPVGARAVGVDRLAPRLALVRAVRSRS